MYPLKFFEVPETMKNEPCAECGQPNCDVLVVENRFGGNMVCFHENCLDAVIETADALEDDEE